MRMAHVVVMGDMIMAVDKSDKIHRLAQIEGKGFYWQSAKMLTTKEVNNLTPKPMEEEVKEEAAEAAACECPEGACACAPAEEAPAEEAEAVEEAAPEAEEAPEEAKEEEEAAE